MPSVPKYLRTMFSHPLKGCCFRPNDRAIQYPKSSKKMSDSCAHDKRPPAPGPVVWLTVHSHYGRFFLSPAVGGGCVTLIGSEAGKLSSSPCSSDFSSRRLRSSSRSPSAFSPSSFSATVSFGIPMRGLLAAARGRLSWPQRASRRGRSPVSPAGRGKYNRRMRTVTCIEDLRRLARRKVPRAFFDYAEAGSYSQETLHANRGDLERIRLRQRVLVDVSQRDLATTIVGEKVSLPLAL